MRLTKNIKLAWNGFFLLMALIFCSLLLMLVLSPATINTFAETHKQNYVVRHHKMAELAIVSLNQGNSKPIENLLDDDFLEIKKGDRLYPIKRHLLLTLVQRLHTQKSNLLWLKWAKEWRRLDERDVTGMTYYYAALLHSDTHYAEGLQGLKEAALRFPQHILLNQFYQAEISHTPNTLD